MWSCPFCGRSGQRTKEHVWPRWLRRYPMYAVMNDGYAGQRFKQIEHEVIQDGDRFLETPAGTRHVAAFLPHVQVSVCRNCNSGWMSRMEIAVENILDPMIRGERVVLGPDEQTLLAAWASKCAYAYAADISQPQNRPWSADQYRDLMNRREPSPRATVYLGNSTAPLAYVAEMVDPLFMSLPGDPAEQLTTMPPAGAGAYLAAHSVVFITHWLPDDMMGEDGDWHRDIFTADIREGLTGIWPPTEPITWPTPDIPEERLVEQAGFMLRVHDLLALPVHGLTAAEIEQVRAEYLAGADPQELRQSWGRP